MSLRLRLTLILGSAFVLLWSLAAVWMLFDLRNQLMLTPRSTPGIFQRAWFLGCSYNCRNCSKPRAGRRSVQNSWACPKALPARSAQCVGEILASSRAAPGSALGVQDKGFHERNIDGVTWRTFTLIEGDMRVTTADRLDERDTLKHSILLAAAAPVLLALIGSLLVLWFGLSRELSPLRRIRQALAQRSADSIEALHVEGLPQETATAGGNPESAISAHRPGDRA